ncbi:two-component system sensor histidine kinase CssS [Natranaerovirga pectinivora]|uniref:histidine kinase n=1 Tax=Natranaerovirga pectinivora TaxID=682400 RepID=A0A4R3MKQ2_9FIRM|nr:HAMP domain-containing sensor histidine kinase [Natranaerovirga pectinivora]TCT13002.1 two-component system sensor histidine kinase CssS [Natranaerovirga pectinivora]
MKRFKLSTQITILYLSVVAIVVITLVTVLPTQIKKFFVNEIYSTIEEEQANFNIDNVSIIYRSDSNNLRTVNHFIINHRGDILLPRIINTQVNLRFLNEVIRRIQAFRPLKGKYVFESSNNTLYYVIKRVEVNGTQSYLVSYMSELYANQVTQNMFNQIMFVTAIILSVGTILFVMWVRHIVKPIKIMEKQVRQISQKEWDTTLAINRKDEIGELAKSIEIMKDRLMKQEMAQQEMFQNISHDLKTPISIIKNYALSIIDDIHPYGTVEDTAKVINDEAERMLEKVQSILYINRLNYLSQQMNVREKINMKELIENLVNRYINSKVIWDLNLSEVDFVGEEEQWKSAIENIITNMLRYAKTTIKVSLREDELIIENDGEPIEKDIINTMFQPYVKGKKGSFGLGLAITSKICKLYHYNVRAINIDNGVRFIIYKRK